MLEEREEDKRKLFILLFKNHSKSRMLHTFPLL